MTDDPNLIAALLDEPGDIGEIECPECCGDGLERDGGPDCWLCLGKGMVKDADMQERGLT